MFSCGSILCRRVLLAAAIFCLLEADAFAAFGGLVPLSWSGQLSYNYGYVDSGGNEAETYNLLLGMNASGYVWRPWFATTSMALNVGLSDTETATTSSDSAALSGSFSLGIFPGSRFPFSVSYSRTDSRSDSYQSLSRVSTDTDFTVTRLSLRQSYRPRAYNQLYNAWYYTSEFDGDSFGSDSTSYGLEYVLHASQQSLTLTSTHLETSTRGNPTEPTTDVTTLSHVYTPSAALGVNSLASYIEVDPDSNNPTSKDSQAFSSFYWRPEHRAMNVSGGVRLTEVRSEGEVTRVNRGLNTNLNLGYRITRALNFNAGVGVGTTDSDNTQTLSTSQAANLSYDGGQHQLAEYLYSWQWAGSVSNATARVEVGADTTTSEQQSVSSSIGHNLTRSWTVGHATSVSGGFSQAVSASKSSELDQVTETLSQSVNASWNRRGSRGSLFASARFSDSRNYGESDTVYDDFGADLSADFTISRLSEISGNMNYTANRNEYDNAMGDRESESSRRLSGSVAYRHNRPFGVYNLYLTSNLSASKEIDSNEPTGIWNWDAIFRYSLGLLSTSLGFRVTENAGGYVTKAMNFQATRSF